MLFHRSFHNMCMTGALHGWCECFHRNSLKIIRLDRDWQIPSTCSAVWCKPGLTGKNNRHRSWTLPVAGVKFLSIISTNLSTISAGKDTWPCLGSRLFQCRAFKNEANGLRANLGYDYNWRQTHLPSGVWSKGALIRQQTVHCRNNLTIIK
jgi:hypothetical protein